jgi:branched-chain amino acid transport system ATP-binding protein
MALLALENVQTYYGHVHALKGVSLQVDEGQVVTLIGANGAGKSTTLRAISGLIRPRTGRIMFAGQDLNSVPAHRIVEMGVSHAPEGRKIFSTLTVQENLNMGAYRLGKDQRAIQTNLDRVFTLFPRIAGRRRQLAGTLSGGEQQMLAIGRAIMTRGQLMLLDEPSMGLAPVLVRDIFQSLRRINSEGVTMLLVEQNARQALRVAQRAYVLETGTLAIEGPAAALARDPRVREVYLGESTKAAH